MNAIQEHELASSSDSKISGEILEKAIHFPHGLPGFREAHRFVLTQTEKERPFAWLRSLDQPSLAFAVIEAYRLVPDYAIDVPDEDLADIGAPTPHECAVLLILRVEVENTVRIYANLRAPIILNMSKRQARQVILLDADNYSESTLFEFGVKK
jgi:flagellar assembly factor FliW